MTKQVDDYDDVDDVDDVHDVNDADVVNDVDDVNIDDVDVQINQLIEKLGHDQSLTICSHVDLQDDEDGLHSSDYNRS